MPAASPPVSLPRNLLRSPAGPGRPGPARGPWATPSQAQLAGREVWQPPPWLPSQKGNHKQGVVQGQTRQHARPINLLGVKQLLIGVHEMDAPTGGAYAQGRSGSPGSARPGLPPPLRGATSPLRVPRPALPRRAARGGARPAAAPGRLPDAPGAPRPPRGPGAEEGGGGGEQRRHMESPPSGMGAGRGRTGREGA